MRTIVDIPDDHIRLLDMTARREGVSRAALVRKAVGRFLESRHGSERKEMLQAYFGVLQDSPEAFGGLDGLAYQQKIRGEWDERDAAIDAWLNVPEAADV